MDLETYISGLPHGGQSELAERLGMSSPYLHQLRKGIRPIPPHRVIEIAKATGWKVRPYDLRRDLYPSASDGVPPKIRKRKSAA
jgi:DNA-binding transcriptional regulator YdaS (Cro superfamily)